LSYPANLFLKSDLQNSAVHGLQPRLPEILETADRD